MQVPSYLFPYVIGGMIAVILTILVGLSRALAQANWSEEERARTMRVASVVLVGWALFAAGLGWLGAYRGGAVQIPTIQYGIAIPILIGLALISRSETAGRIIDAVPQSWLVGVQLYRALGAVFLALYAAGKLPGLFAWPAGVGDIVVGLSAPLVGLFYARNREAGSGAVAAWNILGIADLVVAVTTGFLTSPSALQLFAFDAPNQLVDTFPLVLVPVFLVPLSIVLHAASLAKLRRAAPAHA